MRIRKNAALVTKDERDRYIKAVKSLKRPTVETPHGKIISRYDQFVALHLGVTKRFQGADLLCDGAHGGSAFLPWHRQYLLDYEDALRSDQKYSTLGLLYWDWADVERTKNIMFHDDFMGSEGVKVDGTGGCGPVKSGHFSKREGWKLVEELHRRVATNDELPVPQEALGDELLRSTEFDYSPRPPTQYPKQPPLHLPSREELDDLLGLIHFAFDSFSYHLEHVLGTVLRAWLGGWSGGRGTMSSMSSANDPAFFVYHTSLDWVWARWQANGHPGSSYYPKNHSVPFGYGADYGHGLHEAMWPWDRRLPKPARTIAWLENFLSSVGNAHITPADVLDFRALGYTYDTLLPKLRACETAEKLEFSEPGDEHGFRLRVTERESYRIDADDEVLVSLYGPNAWEPLPETGLGTEFSLEEGEYFVVARCRQGEGEGSFVILSE